MHLIWDVDWMSSIRASRMRRSRTVVAQRIRVCVFWQGRVSSHTRGDVPSCFAAVRQSVNECDVAPPSPEIWKRSTDRCTAKSTVFLCLCVRRSSNGCSTLAYSKSIHRNSTSQKKLYVYYSCKKNSTSSCTFGYNITLENQQNHFHRRLSDRQLYTMKTNSFSVRRSVLRHPFRLISSADSPLCHFPITVDAFDHPDHCRRHLRPPPVIISGHYRWCILLCRLIDGLLPGWHISTRTISISAFQCSGDITIGDKTRSSADADKPARRI